MNRSWWSFALVGVATAMARGQAVEQEFFANPAGDDDSWFGESIAADGDIFVVGAERNSTLIEQNGSAFVYRRDATTGDWHFEQQLLPSDPESYSRFGAQVAIALDLIVVGAPSKDETSGSESGAAYVFRRDVNSGTWAEEQKLTASKAAQGDAFGSAVAVAGDMVVVGAPLSSPNGIRRAGSAYVFRYVDPTMNWLEQTQLVDPDAVGGIFFGDLAGAAVATDGVTVFVASPFSAEPTSVGSIGVWIEGTTGWSQPQELVAQNSDGVFGSSLATYGGELAVGAPQESTVGAAYVFEWDGTAWNFDDRVAPSAGFGQFGQTVALRENVLAVGDPGRNVAGQTSAGSAWLFRRRKHSAEWQFDGELAASKPKAFDDLATSVALAADSIFTGVLGFDGAAVQDGGAVARYDVAEISLAIEPTAPAPGALMDFDVHRGDPGDLFLVVVEDVDGVSLFVPVIADVFGADQSRRYQVTAPSPAFGSHIGLRAWKVSNIGPVVVSNWAFVDV